MTDTPTYVVIGGGISGLAAALRLRDRAPAARITLIERDRRLGGKIVTTRALGYTIEGGPDSFLASKPAGLDLCRELGIEDDLQSTRPEFRGSSVMRQGELVPIPEGLSGLVPARLDPLLASSLLSPEGKERVRQEPQIPPLQSDRDESLAAFIERRFGREVYDRLIEALMSGIYAGSGETLSVMATFPQLRRLEREYGSLVRGLEAGMGAGQRAARTGFLAPVRGMQQIVDAASRALGSVSVVRRHEAISVRREGREFDIELNAGQRIRAQGIVVATPAPATARLISALDPDIAEAFASVPTVSTTTVALGYRTENVPKPLNGYGYLIPRLEGRPVTASTWVSSKWAKRAPEGRTLLRLFLGRAGQEEPALVPNDEIVALATSELRDTLGITAAPEIVSVTRWPEAMPQYTVGHAARIRGVRERLAQLQGLAIAGNALSGVGIPDCIQSGWTAADEVLGASTDRGGTQK